VVLAAKGGIDAVSTRERYPRIAELPFDAAYRLMATVHEMTGASGRAVIRCFVKGTPDQLLARAATVLDAGTRPVPADSRSRQRYLAESQRLGEQGRRAIAVTRKDLDPAAFDPGAGLLGLVTGLELLALAGMADPPRPTARTSIAAAARAGIRVRMITSDYAVTAAAAARHLGIDGTVITGAQFGAISDEEALAKIDGIGVIARVSPQHKVRLVDALRKHGQIVAMTCDGVNDAPAVELGRGLPPGRPVMTRGLIAWLAFTGLLTAIGTLGVISWADHAHGLAVARTMGMVTFALFSLFFSIESKDQRDSAFSLGTFSDKTFAITTGASFLLLLLSTVLGIFQTVMKTIRVDVPQWLICTAVALSIVAAAKIRKAARRRGLPGIPGHRA
jgi:magnesium-transporting ATPase (P-type)